MNVLNIVNKLFKAIFGDREVVSSIPTYDYTLQEVVVNRGVAQVMAILVPTTDGKTKTIEIKKRCMASYLGLPKPSYLIFNKKDEKAQIATKAMWDRMKVVVFGSGIKGDDKQRSKFFMYPEAVAKQILGNSAADWSAYGPKLFTDLKYVKEASALVLSYEEYVERLRAIGFYTDIQEPGNDGSAVCRYDFVPQTGGFLHDQIVATPTEDWRGMFESGKMLNMPLLKGAIDAHLVTNEQFDAAFGVETEIVLIKKDMIKVNYKNAKSGLWNIGFTFNTEKPFDLNIQWETTQFLGKDKELRDYLLMTQRRAIDKAHDLFSTKEKVIEYLGFQIDNKEDSLVETKLLAAIMSNLPYEFSWIQKQIQDMRVREIFDAIKCYGIKAKGAVLWTDNVYSQTSIRYMSKKCALEIGGDNDHDLFGYFVSNKLGLMMLIRFPMVAGVEFRPIPKNIHVDDHFAEFVELCHKHAMRIPFNRNMIKEDKGTTRITDGVEYTRHIARKIVGDSGIGLNTIMLKRFCSRFYDTHNAEYINKQLEAAWGIEAGAIGLKFNVADKKKTANPEPNVKLKDLYPMEYRNQNPKVKADFLKDFGTSDLDSILFTEGYRYAYSLVDNVSTRHPKTIMIDTSAAVGITDKFIARVMNSVNYYNASIVSAMTIEDPEVKTQTISSICNSLSDMGRKMSIGELQVAIATSFEHAGEYNIGAFGIHLAGHRILEVFGTEHTEVKMADPRVAKSLAICVYANKSLDICDINKDKWTVNADGQLVIGDIVFNLGKGMSLPNIKEITVVSNYKKADNTLSDRSFWLTTTLN